MEMVIVVQRPNTLKVTIEEINPVMYRNMYTAVVMLFVMSVSTDTAVRSLIAMGRHGENCAPVGIGLYTSLQGQKVGCRTHHLRVQSFSANIPPK